MGNWKRMNAKPSYQWESTCEGNYVHVHALHMYTQIWQDSIHHLARYEAH